MSEQRPLDRTGRFLMAVIDGGGTLPPAMGLAAELVRRGHVVGVLADPTVEQSAKAAGCEFTAWHDAPHFDTVDDQTAMVTALETGNPYRQFTAVRDRLLAGPAPVQGTSPCPSGAAPASAGGRRSASGQPWGGRWPPRR